MGLNIHDSASANVRALLLHTTNGTLAEISQAMQRHKPMMPGESTHTSSPNTTNHHKP